MKNNKDILRKNYVEVEGCYFAHEALFVIKDDFEQLLREKAGKPYYIPEKEILLRYKDDEYYEETAQTKKMYRFLEKYVYAYNVNSVEDVFYEVLGQDRKSTRLNSSHVAISYAVFCLKKKTRIYLY